MAIRERLSGNEAVAYAIKQINPDVFPAFPITPSTEIPQYVANYIANGEIDTEFIHVESEHSAMSATLGASAAGALEPTQAVRVSSSAVQSSADSIFFIWSNLLAFSWQIWVTLVTSSISLRCLQGK